MIEYKNKVLDDFQQKSVEELEAGNSVVVAAPTGCGKTLIAEYLLDHFLQKHERAIYTAPIKALSNQKYRDFSEYYGDKVGILTGDVSINPNAQILIMTTEIFRNMLFAQKEALSDVKYIIFDEIHYINDIQRGVIWEESIIFALSHMRFLCLSATIPNACDLADWITKIKKHNVVLIEKKERPVPLFHSIYSKHKGIIPVDRFLKKPGNLSKYRKKFQPKDIVDIIHRLKKTNLFPSICFVFSRDGCLRYAKEASKEFNLLTSEERKEVARTFNEMTGKYDIDKMKSVDMIKKYALKGFGIHNAGILPVLKEVIEVLFGKGLIKVIFVTETFAVGVNMPAKAAIFSSLEKYDGIEFRYLKNNEYFQMAGRAGRRGIDEKGNVISVINTPFLKIDEVERVLDESKLEPLESQFKLSYNTVLNLVDQYNIPQIREILEMSFAQFLAGEKEGELKDKIEQKHNIVDETKSKIECDDYGEFKKYSKAIKKKYRFTMKLKTVQSKIRSGKLGAGRKKKLKAEEVNYKQKLNKINKTLSNISCQKCENKNRCKKIGNQIRNYSKRIYELENAVKGNQPDHYDMFIKKYDFLKKAGYIEDTKLTYRGRIASRIYGYELIVAELAIAGFFKEFDPDELNVLCACMVYEINPKKDFEGRIKRNEIYYKIKQAKKVFEHIKRQEIRCGLEPSKTIYLDVIKLAWSWSRGADFKYLLTLTHLSEGDIIRLFRQVIDLLQQIKRVFAEDEQLVDKIKKALEKINRDIVNVSEYISEADAEM
ncbi:MAG: DEAD/DEAH box helicase [Candidatus Muiribacteriota bacterium]